MSFSSNVKEELIKHIPKARHCQMAELSAIFTFCGNFVQRNDEKRLIFLSIENDLVANKCFTLLKKAFTIYKDERRCDAIIFDEISGNIAIADPDLSEHIYTALTQPTIVKNSCCKRAFLRGAYLAGGSISDPEKSYHMEIVCKDEKTAAQVLECFSTFDVDAKTVIRSKYHVVYIKDSAQIVQALNVIEAPVALMELENTIIYKGVVNSVNRVKNCDIANINKTLSASQSTISDIEKLKKSGEYDNIPSNLREIADLRLEYPEVSLKELGELMDPPLSKSGVNHRLRKISELAKSLSK